MLVSSVTPLELMLGKVLGVGAAAASTEDAQRFTFPIILPLFVPILLAEVIVSSPRGTAAMVLSWIPLTAPLVVLVFWVVWPLASLFYQSIIDPATGMPSLHGFETFFSEPRYVEAFFNTIKLGLISTIGTLLLGAPLAYVVARYDFPGKAIVAILPLTTIVLPDIIALSARHQPVDIAGSTDRLRAYYQDRAVLALQPRNAAMPNSVTTKSTAPAGSPSKIR